MSVVVALLQQQQQQQQLLQSDNTTVDTTTSILRRKSFDTALNASVRLQNDWRQGRIQSYDIVDLWLNDVIEYDDEKEIQQILDRVNVLVTTPYNEKGVISVKASNRAEL